MSRTPLGVTLLTAAALALGVLGPASARTQAPRYGGTIVVGLAAGDPDTLDPTVSLGSGVTIFIPMCLRLYDRAADQGLLPLLAASVPVPSKDKLTYTIELRKGIRFNDGTPFNAQAVVTTVQRYMTFPGSTRRNDYAAVESVTAQGEYTVVYHLKARDATFVGGNPYVLSPAALAAEGANFAANPVCVGPFMFDHRVVGDHVTLTKSPYWYRKGDVFLDKIVYKTMPNPAAAAAALKAGDIQVLTQVSTTELEGVRSTSSLRVLQAPQLGWMGVVINVGNRDGVGALPYRNVGTPLASSAKLRQAFEQAIDRKTLASIVFGGLVQPSCMTIAPSNPLWYGATKIPCAPYDPAGAKKLVAASGLPNPTVRMLVSNTGDLLRLAQFIQAQEAAVGINVVIDVADALTVLAREAGGSFDVAVGGFVPGNPDPHLNTFQFLATSGVRNYSGYSSPRLDYVLANGLKATDTRARAVNYRVAMQVIAAERPIIPLYNPITFAAYNTSLSGVFVAPTGSVRVANARYR